MGSAGRNGSAPIRPAPRSFAPNPGRWDQGYARLPVYFEPNLGQIPPGARFLGRGGGYSLLLNPSEAFLVLQHPAPSGTPAGPGPRGRHYPQDEKPAPSSEMIRMNLRGANGKAEMETADPLPGVSNYFIGKDPSKWRRGVPHYAVLRAKGVYPGIDLAYHGNGGRVEHDFEVAPGADPKAIQWELPGEVQESIDAQGNLDLTTSRGKWVLESPVCYQVKDGQKTTVECRYALGAGNRVGFEVEAYDSGQTLVIDPTLVYSTYLGGSSEESYNWIGLAVDASGNAYVAGLTSSANFPVLNPYQASLTGGTDAFITKIDPSGSGLVYSTYLGGSSGAIGYDLAVDSAGDAYVTGVTSSTDFPTVNPIQGSLAGGENAFVTELNPAGNALVYSTYLGGSADDAADGIAVDGAGNVYVTGGASSSNFPLANAYQSVFHGTYSAFVAKIATGGAGLVYSTYLSGSEGSYGSDIAVDSGGNAYVAGRTGSADFPTVNAFQSVLAGSGAGFVTKFNPSGSALVYSTYFGGSGGTEANAIAVDGGGNAYITGTTGPNLPLLNPIQPNYLTVNYYTAFVAKLNAPGNALAYSTYLGGSDADQGFGIGVDSAGDAYVTGTTFSSDFPVVNALFPVFAGDSDAFVTEVNAAGTAWAFSTYLGGSGSDEGWKIKPDAAGANLYVAGDTTSTDFPTANAFQPENAGNWDIFVVHLAADTPTPTGTPSATPSSTPSAMPSATATAIPTGTLSGTPTPPPTVTPSPTAFAPCQSALSVFRNLFIPQSGQGPLTIGVTLCSPGSCSLEVYNTAGEHIRTLANAQQPAGSFQVTWDGKNGYGDPVASGVYIIQMVEPLGVHLSRVAVTR